MMMKKMIFSWLIWIIHIFFHISITHWNSPFCGKACGKAVKSCEFLCRSCGKQRDVGHKLSFCQGNIHPASVGEAISLPCSTTYKYVFGWANLYNVYPDTIQPNRRNVVGGGRLIASPTEADSKPASRTEAPGPGGSPEAQRRTWASLSCGGTGAFPENTRRCPPGGPR